MRSLEEGFLQACKVGDIEAVREVPNIGPVDTRNYDGFTMLEIVKKRMKYHSRYRVADPHHFNAVLDPSFHINADPGQILLPI